ncbi:Mobile element protein [Methanosarcina barkeri MS]|uniref:Mobile element protein n=1 Tax=Methanosarcina barkeri MS TaxID=1434108 RepID=A0A0E3QTD7_METBA|nr:Mobile element protein [Methanosarcina barkeri MS]
MNNFSYERLHTNLQYLKLNTIEDLLDNCLEIAARDSKTTMEVLDYLFEQEKKHRESAAMERRMKSAVFPVKKTLEEFDFEFQSSIDKKVIEDLATLRFAHNAENVVLLGPPGVGKSHLAIALGIEAVKAGISVYFTNTGNLIERLKIANREGILEKKLKGLMKFKVLIIDEMGYLPFDEEGAHCLFQLISRRYEKSSTIFTSNKSYGEWGEIFKDHVIAAAVLDRIVRQES